MRDETLYMAYAATYLAEFRWIKAALDISYRMGPSSGVRTHVHVPISPAQRAAIYARDGGRCYMCGLPIEEECREGPWACTIDHVRPLSHHGIRKAMSNLALAHQQCNQIKHFGTWTSVPGSRTREAPA